MLFEKFEIIDLTHPLSSKVPSWNGSCGFCLETKQDYDQMFCVQKIKAHAGIGTHMDAPSHCKQGGCSISDISLDQLVVPVCVIDVSKKAHADYEISSEDIKIYEKTYGLIPQGSLVIGYTGWSQFWTNPDAYRNVDAKEQMHFPAFSSKAADFLLEKNIVGIAIDTFLLIV